jgi:ABC-type uncharacterized transport system permease subunit
VLLLFIMLFSSSVVIISILTIVTCTCFWTANSYPVMALAFFTLAYVIWTKGVNSYTDTGS